MEAVPLPRTELDPELLFERWHTSTSGMLETLVLADTWGLRGPARRRRVFHGLCRQGALCRGAHYRRLRALGLLDRGRGAHTVTPLGRQVLMTHVGEVAEIRKRIEDLLEAEREADLAYAEAMEDRLLDEPPPPPPPMAPVVSMPGPDDRIEAALGEVRGTLSRSLLVTIGESPPAFFEQLALDLLHAMGYGTGREDLHKVGGSGDGGIDGIISLDRLGLEKVYVQAKRWKGTVGRPEIQGFYGALAGKRASKGVFITTSSFTREAREFALSVEKLVLVDGTRLAALMIDHGVGVLHRLLKLPRIDSEYFPIAPPVP